MFKQKINYVLFIDKFEIVCSTKNKKANQPPPDLKSITRNRLSDSRFKCAYGNDLYIIGNNYKYSTQDNFKNKIVIQNKPLYLNDFVAILKE